MTEFVEFGLDAVVRPIVFFFDATVPNTSRAFRAGHFYTDRNHVTFAVNGELDGSSVVIQGAFKDNPRSIVDADWIDLATLTSTGSYKLEERVAWLRVALTNQSGIVVPPDPNAPIRLDPINWSTTTENFSSTFYNFSLTDAVVYIDPNTGAVVPAPPPGTGAALNATVFMN